MWSRTGITLLAVIALDGIVGCTSGLFCKESTRSGENRTGVSLLWQSVFVQDSTSIEGDLPCPDL